jgi:hypothetical protein
MKNTLIIALSFILTSTLYAQSPSKNPGSLLLGKYVGYSESYSMGVISGRDIIVPGINHTFTILSNGLVNLIQISDKGDKANYKGKYTIVQVEEGKKLLKCKMTEITKSQYPSTPEYNITFNSDGAIECVENPGGKTKIPPFSLNKQ